MLVNVPLRETSSWKLVIYCSLLWRKDHYESSIFYRLGRQPPFGVSRNLMTQDGAGELLLSHAQGSAAGPPGHLVPTLVPVPQPGPPIPPNASANGRWVLSDSFGPPCSLSAASSFPWIPGSSQLAFLLFCLPHCWSQTVCLDLIHWPIFACSQPPSSVGSSNAISPTLLIIPHPHQP